MSQVLQLSRRIAMSLISGLLAGLGATLFLYLLDWAQDFRKLHPGITWGLPLAGFAIGWVYHHVGQDIQPGNNLVLDEIHDPKKIIPWKMSPFILLSTIVSHLFGASVGREGTVVQMGASLADQMGRFFGVNSSERKSLLIAGAGAGFGAALGAPWAGAIFGMEVIQTGKLHVSTWLESLLASFAAYYCTRYLAAPHSQFLVEGFRELAIMDYLWIALAGIAFGLSVQVFVWTTHFFERVQSRIFSYSPLKPLLGGVLLSIFFFLEGSDRFMGLGISRIQNALTEVVNLSEPLLKLLFTSLSIGSGFKGGEFIPLVYIGTTLGSYLSSLLPVPTSVLATAGFAAVFAGAANTPLACTVMAMELFGLQIGPAVFVACIFSFYSSGNKGIYAGQRFDIKKSKRWTHLVQPIRSLKKLLDRKKP